MDSSTRTDLIPQYRELRKPYFLYRTPDALGTYLQREVYRALFSRKDPLTRFLMPAQLTGPQVKPPKIEYDFEGRAPSGFVQMKHLSRAEIAAFKEAAADFLKKADPDAPEKITPHEQELRLHFRLPDPDEEPDAYWLYGPPNDRKLCILWGCELKQNSSLLLLPSKATAPGASIAERLEARATPWAGLQAQALEMLQKNKEPLAEFIGSPVVDAKGLLKSVTVGGKALSAEAVSAPRYIPAKDIRRLAAAAAGFYAKARPDDPSTSAFEKEMRAALRFPDPGEEARGLRSDQDAGRPAPPRPGRGQRNAGRYRAGRCRRGAGNPCRGGGPGGDRRHPGPGGGPAEGARRPEGQVPPDRRRDRRGGGGGRVADRGLCRQGPSAAG